ncbi:MAG: lipoprotein [Desulfomonilaceae bacterium]
MKKWLLIALILVILSGCSWNQVWKWIDEMDYERDDQTVRIVDIFIK